MRGRYENLGSNDCLVTPVTNHKTNEYGGAGEVIALLHGTGAGGGHPFTKAVLGYGIWQVPVIAISSSITVLLFAAGEALLHLVGVKPTPTPPTVRSLLPADQQRAQPT